MGKRYSMCPTLVTIMLFGGLAIGAPATRPAKFEAPDGVTYHGVCLPGYWSKPEFEKNIAAYRKLVTDKPIALHSLFEHCMENGHWNTWRWMKPTPDGKWGNGVGGQIELSRAQGFTPIVAWTWMDWHDMDKSPKLQDLTAGKYDWYLDDWIKGIKEYKDPIFIRLSHEMDGDWYPYSGGYKKDPKRNTPQDYVAYWRYIVDRFRKAGVTNVAWVWCVSNDSTGGKPWKDYYPGDDYVDWLAIDIYSNRNAAPMLRQFASTFDNAKPIMIPEGGTADEQTRWNKQFTSNAAWTKELFDAIESTPRVKAVCWFQWSKECNIERDPDQLQEFQKRIAADRYSGRFVPPRAAEAPAE